jgi:Rrf2 family protein
MSSVLKISEAASLALHTMVYLAANDENPASTPEIARILNASENHLSKVLQRLTKAGLAHPIRGPKGGFTLGKPADQISLLDVYEAIEGPLESTSCLLGTAGCGDNCLFGGLLESVNHQVKMHFQKTMLSDLHVFKVNKTLAQEPV